MYGKNQRFPNCLLVDEFAFIRSCPTTPFKTAIQRTEIFSRQSTWSSTSATGKNHTSKEINTPTVHYSTYIHTVFKKNSTLPTLTDCLLFCHSLSIATPFRWHERKVKPWLTNSHVRLTNFLLLKSLARAETMLKLPFKSWFVNSSPIHTFFLVLAFVFRPFQNYLVPSWPKRDSMPALVPAEMIAVTPSIAALTCQTSCNEVFLTTAVNPPFHRAAVEARVVVAVEVIFHWPPSHRRRACWPSAASVMMTTTGVNPFLLSVEIERSWTVRLLSHTNPIR